MSSCSLQKVPKLEIADKASAMGAGLLGQASTQGGSVGGGEGNESLMQWGDSLGKLDRAVSKLAGTIKKSNSYENLAPVTPPCLRRSLR